MEKWQQILIVFYGVINIIVFVKGYRETKFKKNAYGLTKNLNFLGVISWGDAVVFGLFWLGASVITLILKDWYLFCLIVSVFWVIRSLGETIYWFNQQFSPINRNPMKNLNPLYVKIYQNDSVWFAYQIIWQCVTVISIIFSIYFSHLWTLSRF